MEFYISPDRRQELERKLEKMFKHLEHKPNVKISDAEQVVKEINYIEEDGYSRCRYKIQACHVEIEDIETQDWVLVATVAYDINSMLMGDARYFKQIPEQYGLGYMKCDHCGSVHKSRKESHILYNPKEDKWMQVGSTCINKMLNGGKYLNGLMIELYKCVQLFGGCDSDEWFGGGWRPSNKYKMEAVRFDEAMMVCEEYKKEHGSVWFKPEYEQGRKIADGTNDGLMQLFRRLMREETVPSVDSELFSTVKAYYDEIPYGECDEYEKTMTQKIKDAFNDEYILLCEMYLAWFAIANYKESITRGDFESLIKEKGFEKGMKINIKNAKLLGSTYVAPDEDDYYGCPCYYNPCYYDCVFESEGVVFDKHLSNIDTLDKYKNEDGTYSFCAEIKYIALRKQQVCLGGRLSKIKK